MCYSKPNNYTGLTSQKRKGNETVPMHVGHNYLDDI